MGQEIDFQKREALFGRRIKFDLPRKMSAIHELRERVRLAEMAAVKKPNVRRRNRQALRSNASAR